MPPDSMARIRAELLVRKDKYLGCSNKELAELQQIQKVTCLPELYQEIMHVMGKDGIDSTSILAGNASYEGLLNTNIKEWMFDDLQRENILCPENVFVFFEHQGYLYYFFRTKDCEPDPPVYIFQGPYCFYRVNSLSEFFLEELMKTTRSSRNRFELAWLYDPKIDDFYSVSSDLYDQHLSIETVLNMLRVELEGKSEGCSDQELAELRQTQNVACLPSIYRDFMRLAGKDNSRRIFRAYGSGNWEDIMTAEGVFTKPKLHDILPQDIFVCCIREDGNFCFFRTKDCQDNPPLFLFHHHSNGSTRKVYKLADTLSQFFLQELDPNGENRSARRGARLRTGYSYDLEQDDFVPLTSPR